MHRQKADSFRFASVYVYSFGENGVIIIVSSKEYFSVSFLTGLLESILSCEL